MSDVGNILDDERDARGGSSAQGASDNGALLGFIESVAGDSHVRVEENLGDGFVRLRSSEAERRQAMHDIRAVEDIIIELLRNSRDADADAIFLATTRDGATRTITILDNGRGIPEHMHEKIFEPRVTSKLDTMSMDRWGVHGRGMALFSIKSNVDTAEVIDSAEGKGTAIFISVDTEKLPEKTDQSSVPQLQRDEDGNMVVARGPHNINRKVIEFALETRHDVDIYLGSPAEISATLLDYGDKTTNEDELLFNDDTSELPICQRLAACGSATDLMQRCSDLGLNISERTAHRILHGQIAPLKPYYNIVTSKKSKAPQPVDIFKDNRVLKISKEDLGSFSRKLEDAFESIAGSYYISLKDEPKITIGKDSIKVTFPIDKE
ncbi:MAG: ATP-binding protein [Coriobacteriales bacterium]|jgi:hypothetical protein